MAVLSLQEQLEASHARLLELQNQMKPLEGIDLGGTIEVPAPAITLEQIQAMIDKGVASKLEELGQPVSIPVITKPLTPLECINMLFTPDEVTWLCNPAVLRGVDNFIMGTYIQSDEGKATLQQLFKSYREYYENKS
jgi:hypothetical protein